MEPPLYWRKDVVEFIDIRRAVANQLIRGRLHDSRVTTLQGVAITFCVSRRRRKMYCRHPRLCVCVSVCLCLSAAVRPHYCTDPDVTCMGAW